MRFLKRIFKKCSDRARPGPSLLSKLVFEIEAELDPNRAIKLCENYRHERPP